VRKLSVRLGGLELKNLRTVYFGGGSPALCDLGLLAPVLKPLIGPETEFTIELHPLDVTAEKLDELKALGVNRISMGVQSLDDDTLARMGRRYTLKEAEQAFACVRKSFDNAGIDLIVGYPGDACVGFERLKNWGLRHCSVYSLQNERGLKGVPSDEWVLDRIREIGALFKTFGLNRYEISNYAMEGFECRHNLAVWRGEDYIGLGEGAFGRVGLKRMKDLKEVEVLTPEKDALERRIFRLRTREGLDAAGYPQWDESLAEYVNEGILTKSGNIYKLTERGTEVCDTVLGSLI